MASIADILNKYRARNQAITAPPSKSLEMGGVGTVRRDVESERIARERQIAEQTGAAQLSVESKVMDEGRKQAAMEREEQLLNLKRQSREERQRYQIQSTKLLDNLDSARRELTSREKLDQMETAASNIRLSNEKYRYELADRGRRLRLDDGQKFDLELKKSIFDEELAGLRDNYQFMKALDLEEDKWNRYLASIDMDSVLELSKPQPSSAGIYEGLGKITQAATSEEGQRTIKKWWEGGETLPGTTAPKSQLEQSTPDIYTTT